ncbi:sensor histidine kinase [Spirosoma radiotolerans]|uniref:Histidine kinase n=1 Tax=Spirosoma radiotolerans TaxID=1379870 RepID=A0A0E3ZVR6_9BACT|nr:histidine kinase [Spirosoma radiotolerans]AKD55270.1 histidine kinase [Spirosoma radiotolerans]
MQQLNDKWMRLGGVALLALVGQWVMFGYTNVPYPADWRIPLFFMTGSVVVWECNRRGIIVSRQRYPELAQTGHRVLFQLIWFVLFASAIRISQTFIYHQIGLFPAEDYFLFKPYFFNTLVSVVGTIQVAAVFEGMYLYERWKVAYIETEELKKVNLQSQLDSLKMQLNPHFLFNNLNSLSSLITTDTDQADSFLNELSSVYRYLLQQNKRDLCPLSDELTFINAYFHLLKARYSDAIFMEVDVENKYLSYQIPTLTLQLLFENAIKHNIILAEQPLRIRVYTRDGRLIVANNRQIKKVTVPSPRNGLQNFITKYKLLGQSPVIVQDDVEAKTFSVSMPLLLPTYAE